jgi:hypothetical protein
MRLRPLFKLGVCVNIQGEVLKATVPVSDVLMKMLIYKMQSCHAFMQSSPKPKCNAMQGTNQPTDRPHGGMQGGRIPPSRGKNAKQQPKQNDTKNL